MWGGVAPCTFIPSCSNVIFILLSSLLLFLDVDVSLRGEISANVRPCDTCGFPESHARMYQPTSTENP